MDMHLPALDWLPADLAEDTFAKDKFAKATYAQDNFCLSMLYRCCSETQNEYYT